MTLHTALEPASPSVPPRRGRGGPRHAVSGLNDRGTAIDGRVERSRRTRQALIDAYLRLAGQFQRPPTVHELAAETGRSVRIIYDRFPSLEALTAASVQQLLAPDGHDVLHRVAGVDRQGRIAFHVATRLRQYEVWRPVWPIVTDCVRRDPDCAAQLDLLTRLEWQRLESLFAPELQVLPPAERRQRLLTLDIALGIEAWIRLRDRHGLPVDEAAACWRQTVDRLL